MQTRKEKRDAKNSRHFENEQRRAVNRGRQRSRKLSAKRKLKMMLEMVNPAK